jgi:hypothetical protein
MRILSVADEPVHLISYQRAGERGGAEPAQLPVLLGTIDALPAELDAIVCTADLQGIVADSSPQESQLLGTFVAEELLVVLTVLGVAPSHTGIVLAGDFYSAPQANQRGASGDVGPVWEAFRKRYRWVVGVLGNHDRLDAESSSLFKNDSKVHCLDGTVCRLDGLALAGISGIIGKDTRPLRRSAKDFIRTLEQLRRREPDLIILHPAPSVKEHALRGDEELEAAYHQRTYPLTVCGHVYWPLPFAEQSGGKQFLNVDSRVIVLMSQQ